MTGGPARRGSKTQIHTGGAGARARGEGRRPHATGRGQPFQHLDLGLPASSKVLLFKPPVCGTVLWPRQVDTDVPLISRGVDSAGLNVLPAPTHTTAFPVSHGQSWRLESFQVRSRVSRSHVCFPLQWSGGRWWLSISLFVVFRLVSVFECR